MEFSHFFFHVKIHDDLDLNAPATPSTADLAAKNESASFPRSAPVIYPKSSVVELGPKSMVELGPGS